ncbi:hypothetical protein [Cupriavidus sp. BIC8F]|uniref:hypothetical protein n=1 Tax=Cupriavidus sp. BIC8F TaxID=3079014 RepID=UPI00291614FB|nr:hypothetical protein [Cupriavidus sp. BIC8F]
MPYIALAFLQFGFIFASAIFRRRAWREMDIHDGLMEMPISMKVSFALFGLWALAVFLAAIVAMMNRKDRAMIFLFLVALFPFFEFWGWFIYSF